VKKGIYLNCPKKGKRFPDKNLNFPNHEEKET